MAKVVIVEGVDRVGKTTLCKKLEQLGFFYFKDNWNIGNSINDREAKLFSAGKLDTTISTLKMLTDQGVNVVVDRLHLTELVYGTLNRAGARKDLVRLIEDKIIQELDAFIICMYANNSEKSSKEAGYDISAHEAKFRQVSSESRLQVFSGNYEMIDMLVEIAVARTFKYDLYFASPFFNPEQLEREEALKQILKDHGFRVFSPKENCFLPANSTHLDRQKVFDENCDAIVQSLAVFAVTDGKDMGTIWEAGFGFGKSKPILYYAETLGQAQFNLMLAQSSHRVFTGREQLNCRNIWEAIHGKITKFEGLIE